MLIDVTKVKYLSGHKIAITFEDGVEGEIDLNDLVDFTGVFKLLKDDKGCAQVFVNKDTGTIEWPNGADIDPVVLYAEVTGKDISDLVKRPAIPG